MKKEIRERIVDYPAYEEEIEKWLRVKGDEKYSQFADMLEKKNIEVTWSRISDLYRYDKRLLINNFRYVSFFEEYLRAILMNNSDDCLSKYDDLEERYFPELMQKVAELNKEILCRYFDNTDLSDKVGPMRELRNRISHNKIMLHQYDLKETMRLFYRLLPQDYREGYRKDINKCVCGLDVDNSIAIMI